MAISFIHKVYDSYQCAIHRIQSLDFIALFLTRLYLAPIFISAGWNKITSFSSMVEWFGNTEWGLGLPMPALMVTLTIIAELVGGFALLFGVGTRVFSVMLLVTMLVAIATVHWQHGWFAITPTDPSTSVALVLDKVGFWGSEASLANSLEASERLDKAKEILQTHGNYDWLTETGNFVILNNGIEFAATYSVMLLVLIFFGAGRYISIDYWVNHHFKYFAKSKKQA